MHPALIVRLAMLSTVSSAAGYLLCAALASVTALIAVIRILHNPTDNWAHRHWSTVAWVLAALCLVPHLGGYPVPVGAIAAIWRTGRPPTLPAAPGQLPMTEGSPDWPWPWDAK